MRPIARRGRCRGFTLIEAMVALAVLALLLGIGIPALSGWSNANRAGSAAGFYAEGLALARTQAMTHNGAARLVLTPNARSGQPDWQVDICFPTGAVPCDDSSGSWSTTDAPAGADPEAAAGFKSVRRPADALPDTRVMTVSVTPSDANTVYFTPLGWINPAAGARIERIDIAPVHAGAFRPQAVALTLAGVASKCLPDASAHDSRGCPP